VRFILPNNKTLVFCTVKESERFKKILKLIYNQEMLVPYSIETSNPKILLYLDNIFFRVFMLSIPSLPLILLSNLFEFDGVGTLLILGISYLSTHFILKKMDTKVTLIFPYWVWGIFFLLGSIVELF
jgi:hypothetical protein